MSTLENYGVYINHLWNISFSIKLWLNVVMEGFVMGLMIGWWTMQNRSELDCGTVGLDFLGSGGQGGTLIASRKMWEKSLIRWV